MLRDVDRARERPGIGVPIHTAATEAVSIDVAAPGEVEAVRAFLEVRIESSVQLLELLESGSPVFRGADGAGRVVAAACVRSDGMAIVQSGERPDVAVGFAAPIAQSCPRLVEVRGDWDGAVALFAALQRSIALELEFQSKERLFRWVHGDTVGRAPPRAPPRAPTRAPTHKAGDRPRGSAAGRLLHPADFTDWDRLRIQFLAEDGLQPSDTPRDRRTAFEVLAHAGRAFGAGEEHGALRSIAAISAIYRTHGQVGSVFTERSARGQGMARAAVEKALQTARDRLGLSTLHLFTEHQNAPAQALYQSLGFVEGGLYGLVWCRDPRATVHSGDAG